MSRIGNAVIDAQERTGKQTHELTNEDLKPSDDTDLYRATVLHDLECSANEVKELKSELTAEDKKTVRDVLKTLKEI